jgi:hypothetical protein
MNGSGSPKLSAWHRWIVLAVSALLALSGLLWMIGSGLLLLDPERDGPEARSMLHRALIVHGVLGYAGAILFGSLLARHVPAGLRQRRRVFSGCAGVGLVGVLLLSALMLYYAGSEVVRELTSWTHQALGVLAIGVVWAHIGMREAPRREVDPASGLAPLAPARTKP